MSSKISTSKKPFDVISWDVYISKGVYFTSEDDFKSVYIEQPTSFNNTSKKDSQLTLPAASVDVHHLLAKKDFLSVPSEMLITLYFIFLEPSDRLYFVVVWVVGCHLEDAWSFHIHMHFPQQQDDGSRISGLCKDGKLVEFLFEDVRTLYEGFVSGSHASRKYLAVFHIILCCCSMLFKE